VQSRLHLSCHPAALALNSWLLVDCCDLERHSHDFDDPASRYARVLKSCGQAGVSLFLHRFCELRKKEGAVVPVEVSE